MWKEVAIEKLKEAGLKLTPQRIKLVELLERMGHEHPSLKTLFEEFRKEFPSVSFSTLYSNVLMLRDLGLVDLFQVGGDTRVEVNTQPHVNLIRGGEVVDVRDDELIRQLESRLGRRVRFVNVVVD